MSLSRGTILAAAAALWHAPEVLAVVRGLDAESEAKFAVGKPFACGGEGGLQIMVPYDALNDDYCDCVDGTDEPGTGACSGQDKTMFHCHNEGSTPQLLYASRVDDGICDCCDGSDEAGLQARRPGTKRCPNNCAELGQIEQQQRVDRMATLREGLRKKDETIKAAIGNRQTWSAEVQRLEATIPALEAAHQEKKKAAEAVRAAANSKSGDELRKENEELKIVIAEQQARIDTMQKELDQLKGTAGGEGKPEKKVVSEYAKWMDGAGDTPGAIEGEDQEDDNEDDDGLPDEEDLDEGASLSTKPTVVSSGGAAAGAAVTNKSPEELAEKAAEEAVRKTKDEVKQFNKKLEQLHETHLGFASLADKCINKHDGQYTYKLCFFDTAKQDHVSLGRWNGWEGPRVAKFTDGQMCPGGPARMMRVIFECGSEEALLDISEPSRCVYETRVTSPGACDDADVAKLEKPPVKHPRDEL